MFHLRLREATRANHDRVDAAYSRFVLGDAASFGDFLTAHAAALIPLEEWIDPASLFPDITPRGSALRADLDTLGREMPTPLTVEWPRTDATRWGALYVVEGSRLGGRMLARSLPDGFPRAYLDAPFQSQTWRALLAALDERGASDAWAREALDSAMRTFDLFEQAAGKQAAGKQAVHG